MNTTTTDSYIELCANGGGYVTQSYPTNFHTFSPKIILPLGADPSLWKEVTASERNKIEAEDEQWQEPPRYFIDLWNRLVDIYGRYNSETGYFELNGILDISYSEALAIVAEGQVTSQYGLKGKAFKQRTNLPFAAMSNGATIDWSYHMDRFEMDVEVAQLHNTLSSYHSFAAYPISVYNRPFSTKRLHTILGVIDFHFAATTINWFQIAPNLVEVRLSRINAPSIRFDNSPKLSFESVRSIANAIEDTSNCVVTFHPDVYAKLTGDVANDNVADMPVDELDSWKKLLDIIHSKNGTIATI